MENNKETPEEIITVVILSDGKSCREVNPLGEKPKNCEGYIAGPCTEGFRCIECGTWEEAESKLRTFEIELNMIVIGHNGFHNEFGTIVYSVGSTHQAVVVNDKMVRIL